MLRIILIAAGTAAVVAAEKAHEVAHAPVHIRIVVGAVFALPFLLAALGLEVRAGKAKAAASAAERPVYSFRQPGRRG